MDQTVEKDLLIAVRQPKDAEKTTELETEHLPAIDAPDRIKLGEPFEVTVEVARGAVHPSQAGHFIEFIEVSADDTRLARVDLAAGTTRAKVSFRLILRAPAKELRARVRCSRHGEWAASRPLEVV